MCLKATACVAVAAVFLLPLAASAQFNAASPLPDWRRIGPTALDLGLPSLASGPVSRVWYSADGSRLYARTHSGRVFMTADFVNWAPSATTEPVPRPLRPDIVLPEPKARALEASMQPGRLYAVGSHAYRSDDAGATWTNLTDFQAASILGQSLSDLTVSPQDANEVTVAGSTGLWRSLDGGRSWAGLNDKLPNLPAARLDARAPGKLAIESSDGQVYVWTAGGSSGWTPALAPLAGSAQRTQIGRLLGRTVSAAAGTESVLYAATFDGRIHVSRDAGITWPPPDTPLGGEVKRIFTEGSGSFAIAITSSNQRGRVLRTVNSGLFWEDITADLPAGTVAGLAVDAASGAVYVATKMGLFFTYTDTVALGPAAPWTLLREGPSIDVALGPGGHLIYAAFEGEGIVGALAPHRYRKPSVVSAADRMARATAPGALVTVLGAKVEQARAGYAPASVLVSSEVSSELQLPFEMANGFVVLSLEEKGRSIRVELPVLSAAPGIFTDPEGKPLVLNADSGLVLDTSAAVRPATRLQIFATGLGQVSPPWPAGMPAPQNGTPNVVAPIQVFLGAEALEVTKASLAPGYVGLYIVEVALPSILDRGEAELYLQSGNAQSNRIRLFLEP